MTVDQLQDQRLTDVRRQLDSAAVAGAAIRGELGEESQRIALESWAAEYRALKAAGQVEAAAALKALVKRMMGVEG